MKLSEKLDTRSWSKGFTLIELLVVVAIISLLSSVVLASVNEARKSARDSQRVQDLLEIRNALEMYANANNGEYPIPANSIGDIKYENDCSGSDWNNLANLEGTYMPQVPHDPLWQTSDYCYYYLTTSDSNYELCGIQDIQYVLYFKAEGENLEIPQREFNSEYYCIPPIK